jgi:glycosyltransferase involved in cell wall biosynthesis
MKIGITTSVIQRGRSGVAQYVLALVRALRTQAAHRHRFTLFVLEDDLPLFSFARDRMEIVPVRECYRSPVADITWHQTVLPGLAQRHGLDVLHVPSYRRMVRAAPCATVATIHDLAPFHVAGKYDWARMFYGRVVARRLAHRQNGIIAVSHNTARDLARFYHLNPARVQVVENGLDHKRFRPGPTARAWAAEHGVTKPFFLYIARLEHPGKNHVRLIDAFNRFKADTGSDWQLALGGADWHGAEVVHRCIDESPYSADIRRLGFVGDGDLPTWYRTATAFVFPSLFEGFGLPPLEAMACGCPVACSTRGALADTVGSAAAVIQPESVESIKHELTRLATDPGRRATLRAAGLAQAAKFSWERTAAGTLDAYGRAVESLARARQLAGVNLGLSGGPQGA